MNNETIPYVTRNLRHLLAAPNLTETQRTIITRTLATLSELKAIEPELPEQATHTTEDFYDNDGYFAAELMSVYNRIGVEATLDNNEGGR